MYTLTHIHIYTPNEAICVAKLCVCVIFFLRNTQINVEITCPRL